MGVGGGGMGYNRGGGVTLVLNGYPLPNGRTDRKLYRLCSIEFQTKNLCKIGAVISKIYFFSLYFVKYMICLV